MKVVLIHGQNHIGSSCQIGRMAAERLREGEPVTEFFLPRDLNHFCTGCYQCIPDETRCPFYEQKHRIMEAVEAADVLIFTTPTYCLRASAPMKSFLDLTFTYWMSHKPRRAMFRKKAIVISTAAGSGAKSAVKDISTALTYWGVPDIKCYGIAVQAMGWEQVSEKKKQTIQRDIEKLTDTVLRKKVRVGRKTKGLFFMMRMMQKADFGASPAEKAYWQEQGWLDDKRPWKKDS